MNLSVLYLNDTWVSNYIELCDILRACEDVSSSLSHEFIEAAVNGSIPAWLRQIGEINEADAVSQLTYKDDDKEYMDGLKKALLHISVDDTRRPNLSEYIGIESVSYRIGDGNWTPLQSNNVVSLPPDFHERSDLKCIFRFKKPAKLTYTLRLVVKPMDDRVLDEVIKLVLNDPSNKVKTDVETLCIAKSQTEYESHKQINLAGRTRDEEIEILFSDILPLKLKEDYDYKLQLIAEGDEVLLECHTVHQLKDSLLFEVNGVEFIMKRVEYPEHEDYYIGETQATQALWKAVTADTIIESDPSAFKGAQRPVESVSWYDCKKFIDEINEKLKDKLPSGRRFRLPSKVEWEFAAKGGTKGKGSRFSGCFRESELERYAWYNKNSNYLHPDRPGFGTHPVKLKLPNELDLYDMSGNVFEWCEDLYGYNRICCGGSWCFSAKLCEVSGWDFRSPDEGNLAIGFRLAL